jgi:hypothetical protein
MEPDVQVQVRVLVVFIEHNLEARTRSPLTEAFDQAEPPVRQMNAASSLVEDALVSEVRLDPRAILLAAELFPANFCQ